MEDDIKLSEYEETEEGDVYTEDIREHLVDDDELNTMEAAFMKGYEEAL